MTAHVTIATAQALREHGYQHTLEPGDWVYHRGECPVSENAPSLVVKADADAEVVSLYVPSWWPLQVPAADCLHLPTAEQLLEELAAEGLLVNVFPNDVYVGWLVRWLDVDGPHDCESRSLPEAAALAWLASRPAEEG